MAAAPKWLTALIERARATDGQPPFSDQSLVDLRTGQRELLALGEYAAAVVATTEAELVVDPDVRGRGHGTALVEALLASPREELLVWAHGDHPAARALAARFGFEPVRRLLQLRRPGAGGADRSREAGDIRSFRPGIDEDEWLALNARAFASHPEQGSVSRSDLDELEREPWFDAEDFLVLWHGEAMVGYCWLKIEHDIGELYVVGVDPGRQGEGIGRRLVAAGLDRLEHRGVTTAALYVEADNRRAVRLYESVGFTEYSVDIQYRLTRFTRRS
jgi:mycothiol synthase